MIMSNNGSTVFGVTDTLKLPDGIPATPTNGSKNKMRSRLSYSAGESNVTEDEDDAIGAENNPDAGATANKSTPIEYSVLLLGSECRRALYDRLLVCAEKVEHHVQYADITYLTFVVDARECVLELVDAGLEHTGLREMAIRKAHAVVLCYSVFDTDSYHQLAAVAEDFVLRRRRSTIPYVALMADEDPLSSAERSGDSLEDGAGGGVGNDVVILPTDELDETTSNANETEHHAHSSSDVETNSEGYGSSSVSPDARSDEGRASPPSDEAAADENTRRLKRKNKLAELRNRQNQTDDQQFIIGREEGESMAALFSPDCEFLSASYTQYDGVQTLVEKIVHRTGEVQTTEYKRRKPTTTQRRLFQKATSSESTTRSFLLRPTQSLRRLMFPTDAPSSSPGSTGKSDDVDESAEHDDGRGGDERKLSVPEIQPQKAGAGARRGSPVGTFLASAWHTIGVRRKRSRDPPALKRKSVSADGSTLTTVEGRHDASRGDDEEHDDDAENTQAQLPLEPIGPFFSPTTKEPPVKAELEVDKPENHDQQFAKEFRSRAMTAENSDMSGNMLSAESTEQRESVSPTRWFRFMDGKKSGRKSPLEPKGSPKADDAKGVRTEKSSTTCAIM